VTGRGALLCLALAAPLHAQRTLADAARGARAAWLAHDAETLVGPGPRIAIQVPGANPSGPLAREHAVEVMGRYLEVAVERRLEIRRVETTGAGRAVVELVRTYVLRGTRELRHEAVFLGFAETQGRWVVTEIRVAP
jgi:hypothetical protein